MKYLPLLLILLASCGTQKDSIKEVNVPVNPNPIHDTLYVDKPISLAPEGVSKPICDSLIKEAALAAVRESLDRTTSAGDKYQVAISALVEENKNLKNENFTLKKKVSVDVEPHPYTVPVFFDQIRPFTFWETIEMNVGKIAIPIFIILILGGILYGLSKFSLIKLPGIK